MLKTWFRGQIKLQSGFHVVCRLRSPNGLKGLSDPWSIDSVGIKSTACKETARCASAATLTSNPRPKVIPLHRRVSAVSNALFLFCGLSLSQPLLTHFPLPSFQSLLAPCVQLSVSLLQSQLISFLLGWRPLVPAPLPPPPVSSAFLTVGASEEGSEVPRLRRF